MVVGLEFHAKNKPNSKHQAKLVFSHWRVGGGNAQQLGNKEKLDFTETVTNDTKFDLVVVLFVWLFIVVIIIF